MGALLSGILIVVLIVIGWHWLANADTAHIKKLLIFAGAIAFAGIAAALLFTGKPVSALPALGAAMALYQRYRKARWFWDNANEWFKQTGRGAPSSTMTRAEALEVLGLGEGASDDQIIKAHRELIIKFHPDQGGSDYLARQLNDAKEVLIHKR